MIAHSNSDIGGAIFSFRPEIIYVGMTNSQCGLDGRLWQFDLTISGKRCEHGGADRVVFKHRNYNALANTLYVAMWHIECDPKSNSPIDLRGMGEVARAEYECFARCVESFGALPEFNRKKDSPKYSARIGDYSTHPLTNFP